jgi:2-octaprenyl-6-methoxyphenol hydroxylase
MARDMIGIVGTGLSGLLAAVSLGQQEFPITLIGPDTATDDGRTTAIMDSGIEFLKELDVWQECAAQATPLVTMELIDDRHHHIFQARDIGLNEFGFNVSNTLLKKKLTGKIRQMKNIIWHKGLLTKAGETPTGWILSSDKKTFEVSLVVGADGRNSKTREAAGLTIDQRASTQMALVAILQTEKNHHFSSVEWYRPGGPFTLVPMNGKEMALVWCDDETILKQKIKMTSAELGREMTQITQQRLGKLTITNTPQIWPVQPMKARRMTGDHLVLIGEAAHILPPIGAQGFNTSIQDIIELTAALKKAQRLGLAIYDAAILSGYERKRLPAITARYFGTNSLNDLIRAQHPAVKFARRASMKLIDMIPAIKAGLMRAGLGRAA